MNLAELAGLPEEGFAAFLRSVPRVKSPEQVADAVRLRDVETGEYVPHGGFVHHSPDESRH